MKHVMDVLEALAAALVGNPTVRLTKGERFVDVPVGHPELPKGPTRDAVIEAAKVMATERAHEVAASLPPMPPRLAKPLTDPEAVARAMAKRARKATKRLAEQERIKS